MALRITLMALLATMTARADDDPRLWLENFTGEKPMAWAN